ncbi:MAG: inositol monophosphatase family protein [Patescibacteria group bacterium]|nr:inositol monophosphatase family protein [Patescibacteria group bacterium]
MDKQIKKVALSAAKPAGEMLKREYEKFDRGQIMLKSHHEILTKCDLMSQEILINEIRKYFPAHGIISEEKANEKNYSEYCWYLDPIDGTTNFSMHNPLWSISMALAKNDELIFGLIYAPMLKEIYIAQIGQGAELNGRKIFVSKISQGKVLNTFCHGREDVDIKKALAYWRKQKLNELDCRQMGSAALELSYVASGRVESFVAPGTHDWDVAAGVLLVREAGGKVTDFTGRDWRLGDSDIAASNGKVQTQILRAMNK